MIIGVPAEIKEHEYRVGMTPAGAMSLVEKGHHILVEEGAGRESGFSDDEYRKAGGRIMDKKLLFAESELIIKVKEPLPAEYDLFRDGQSLFTYLHLAPARDLTDFLIQKKITAFAYETLTENGSLPLLEPMSEIAGKMAPVVAAYFLQKVHGGSGVLLPRVDDVSRARVLILGAGNAGRSALRVAYNMGAQIIILNRGTEKLRHIEQEYGDSVATLIASEENIACEVVKADAVIGAVLVPGARTPKIISAELVSRMKKGAVIVDISVDQGGCFETTHPTTHGDPIYTVHGVIHYAVANMPGAYPQTSTIALTTRTLKYISMLAENGIRESIDSNAVLRSALNTHQGEITNPAIQEMR